MNCDSCPTSRRKMAFLHLPSQFVSQVRVFTDQILWSSSDGSTGCSWNTLAYWPRQQCHQPQQMQPEFPLGSVFGERKKKHYSSGNKNTSTMIYVKNLSLLMSLWDDTCLLLCLWVSLLTATGFVQQKTNSELQKHCIITHNWMQKAIIFLPMAVCWISIHLQKINF